MIFEPSVKIGEIDFDRMASDLMDDMPELSKKIIAVLKIEISDVPKYFVETLKFIYLVGYFEKKLTPSIKVDLVWHEFILHTKIYMSFCDKSFGRYIHHTPGGNEKENQENFKNTISLYSACFDKMPTDIWCEDQVGGFSCGSCESL